METSVNLNRKEAESLDLFLKYCPQAVVKNTQRDPNAAVSYTRVSGKKQVERASLTTQDRTNTELAERRKWYIMEKFGGTYESAKKDDRKEFNRLKKFLFTNKKVSKVIVYSYDRFSRTGLSAADFIQKLNRMGITVVSATQQVDTTTYTGEFQQNLWLLLGNLDNSQRKEKSFDGTRDRLLEGYWPNHTPLGYTNLHPKETCNKHVLIINKDGELLKKAFYWKASGKYTDVEIVKMLERRGLTVKIKLLHKIFRNPFYCGIIVHKFLGKQVVVGKHPPLIPKELFLRINNGFAQKNANRAKYSKEDEMLPLKVFMKCDLTGIPFTGYMKKKKTISGANYHYYYKVRGKGTSTNKKAAFVHDLFTQYLAEFEFQPALRPLLEKAIQNAYAEATGNVVEREKEINQRLLEETDKLKKVENRYIYDGLEKEIYDSHKSEIKSKMNLLEDELFKIRQGYSTNLELVIKKSLSISQNLSKTWVSSTYVEKSNLQKLMFPEGIRFNAKTGTVRTERVNSVFAIIQEISRLSKNKKAGGNDSSGTFSTQVGVAGFEPTTSCSQSRRDTGLRYTPN